MEQDDANIHDKHSEICIIYINTAHRRAELDIKLDQPMLAESDDEAIMIMIIIMIMIMIIIIVMMIIIIMQAQR
jgi:hypothetical protein